MVRLRLPWLPVLLLAPVEGNLDKIMFTAGEAVAPVPECRQIDMAGSWTVHVEGDLWKTEPESGSVVCYQMAGLTPGQRYEFRVSHSAAVRRARLPDPPDTL